MSPENREEPVILLLSSAPPTPFLDAIEGTDDVSVSLAADLDAALVRLATESIKAVVVDGTDDEPLDAIERIADREPEVPLVLYLADHDPESAEAALAVGATDYVTPESRPVLLSRLRRIVSAGRNATGNEPAEETATDRLREAFYALDAGGRITHWNAAMAEATGVPRSDAVGRALFDLFPSITDTEYADAIERGLDAAESVIREWPDETLAGVDEIWIHPGENGVTVHTVSVPSKQRRDARLLEDLLSGLLVEAGDVVYFKDEESRFVRVSRSKARERGTTREDLRGKSDFDFMPEAEARRRYEDEQRIMRTGTPLVDDIERVDTEDGETRWYRTTKLPRCDKSGEVVGTFGISRDITEIKELEETLSELEALIDRVPVWLLAVDNEGTVTWANDAAAEALVPDAVDPTDRSLAELASDGPLTERLVGQYEAVVDGLLESDTPGVERVVGQAIPLELRTGRTRYCDVRVRPLPPANGEFRGAVLAFHDVTKNVEQERDLERQNQRLERLIGTVSHDLRSPLSATAGRLELAREAAEPEEHIDDAIDLLQRVQSLVDDLLTMTREGRAVESPGEVRLRDVAADAWEPFADGEATLDLRIPETATVRGDRERIRRLFDNLFRNAVEHGGEDVTVTVDETPEGFTVFDDGRGIPEDEREHVFEHGYTTDEAGTGFGLAIVSEIASAHGWSIDVSEGPAGGARFDVRTHAGASRFHERTA